MQFGVDDIQKIDVILPEEVKELLNERIISTEFGVTLNCWKEKLGTPAQFETKSIVEDNVNHFHVDSDAIPNDEETAFKLGIKTSVLLFQKFQQNGFNDIRISYSFHTRKLSKQIDIDQNRIVEEKYYYGDRISFHQIRKGEKVIGDLEGFKYNAMLILEPKKEAVINTV